MVVVMEVGVVVVGTAWGEALRLGGRARVGTGGGGRMAEGAVGATAGQAGLGAPAVQGEGHQQSTL